MTLCIDARMLHSSGIGTYIRNILPAFLSPPFTLSLLNTNAPIYSLREQIAFLCKIPRCDLFWSPHYNAPLLPIRAKRRIATIHDVCHLVYPSSKLQKMAAHALLQNACSQSDLILTVSEFSKGEILKYLKCPESKIHVVYPGVDLEEFSPARHCKKNQLDFPFFLFVGNCKTHKNLETLIQAFSSLNSSDHHLVLIGPHPFDRKLGPLIEKSPLKNKIHCMGHVAQSDLPFFYAKAVALIFPSLYEGFGLPPLEAMASGSIVIASNAASIPEVCGDAALYFSPQDSEELKSQMQRALFDSSLCQDLIEKGAARSRLFSWEKTRNQLKELFLCMHSKIH